MALNKTERDLLYRVYVCLDRIGTLGPTNPADVKRYVQVRHVAVNASARLAQAVSCVGFRDYELAADYIADAEEIVRKDRERPQ